MNRIRSLSLGVLLLRIVFAIAAAFFAWLSAPAAAATPSAESCHAHTFNTPIHDGSTYYTQLERGPPALPDQFSVSAGQEAVDHGSYGTLARQEVSATPATYDYDGIPQLVQAANGGSIGAEPVAVPSGVFSSPELSGVAAKSADEGIDLYRHVSPGELADIGENGFRPGAGSLDGKWFAESTEHASEWGRVLNGGNGAVVKVRVPTSFGNQLMRLEKLDGIGPARYVEPHQLAELNRYGREVW